MSDEAITLEMPLSAVEYLLCKIHLAMVLAQPGFHPDQFDQFY